MRKVVVGFLVFASLLLASPVSALSTYTPRAKAQARIDDAKAKVCETRKTVIETRMANLIRFATNMLSKFDSIATRVQTFYTEKVLPKGGSLANYDALVNDIASKKVLVSDAITKAQTDASVFTCDTGSPKTLFTQFRIDMQAVKQALKNYRTSIKNLIVAVHQGISAVEASENPKASATP